MNKILVIIALAFGLFACDDGKKDNGSGSGAENLGNIKIGTTSPEQPFSIKSVLSTPAMTSFGYRPINLTLEGMDYASIIKFKADDCLRYEQTGGEYDGYFDLPLGVSCNAPYTITPTLFARYTISYVMTSEAKNNINNINTEYGKIEFTASVDGQTEPPIDIEYAIPQSGSNERTVTERIQLNRKTDADYIVVPYGPASFIDTTNGICSSSNGCFSVDPSHCKTTFEKYTHENITRDIVKVSVPQEGCLLTMRFYIGADNMFGQANGFYLRPGDRLDTPVPTNVPVQRFVIKR